MKRNFIMVVIGVLAGVLFSPQGVLASGPDLIITDFSWTPLNPTVSQTDPYIYYNFTVKNIGDTSVTLPVNTEFAVYKNSVSSSNKAGAVVLGVGLTLPPNYSQAYVNKTTMQSPNIRAQAGTFDLIMMADTGNLIQETNESNNTLTRSITIGTTAPAPSVATSTVTVLSPNGGEQFQAGQAVQMPLQWNASCSLTSFSISLYKAGVFVQTMVNNIAAGICSASQTSLPYYTTWPIPSTLQAGSDYKIRVSLGSVSDDSNASFSITAIAPTPTPTPPPVVATSTIAILSPNGGESLFVGDPYTVKWSSSSVESVVFYVTDTQDRVLVTNISGNLNLATKEFIWTPSEELIRAFPEGKYKIAVQGCQYAMFSCSSTQVVTDFSDSYFTVASPSIQPSLAVSVSGGTAITSVPFTDAALAKITFTAAGEDVKVSSLTITRSGISADWDFGAIRLVDSYGTQFGYPISVFTGGKAIFQNLNFVVLKGSSRTLSIKANVTQSMTSGKTVTLGVDAVFAAGAVSGSIASISVIPSSTQIPVNLTSGAVPTSPVIPSSPVFSQTAPSEGSLVKIPGSPDVYVIKDGQKVKITSPQEFEQKGYKWDQIKEVEKGLLEQIAELKAQVAQLKQELLKAGVLLKSLTNPNVYIIKDGKKERITDPETFNKKGYKWDQIKEVSSEELSQIPDSTTASSKNPQEAPLFPEGVGPGSLVKSSGSPTVFYITDNGMKKPIPSLEVFDSYKHQWKDVKIVSQDKLDEYPGAIALKTNDDSKVYFIKDGKKRWIKTPGAFENLKLKWDQIVVVNKTELDAYLEDDSVSDDASSASKIKPVVIAGALSSVINPTFAGGTSTVPTGTQGALHAKIASFIVSADSQEDVRMIQMALKGNDVRSGLFTADNFRNLIVQRENVQIGSLYDLGLGDARFVITPTSSFVFLAGKEYIMDVYADILSSAFNSNVSHTTITLDSVSGKGLKTGSFIEVNADVIGPNVYIAQSVIPRVAAQAYRATLSIVNALSNFAGGQSSEQLIGKYRFTNTSSGDYSITVADIDLGISSTISVSASATRYVTLKRDSVTGTTITKKGFRSSFADITNFTAAAGDGSEITFSPFTISSVSGTGFVDIFVLIDTNDAAATNSISTSIGAGSNVVTWSDGATNGITALSNTPVNGATAIY